jgi:hypothetical protein
MSFSDRVAQIVERVRDTEAEAVHGTGSDVISDDAWFADCADFILPDSLKESKELRYQISEALFWLEPDRSLPALDTSMFAVEHLTKIGQIIVATAMKNGMTASQLGGE